MQWDWLNLIFSLDKPSLGVSRTARLEKAGPISLSGTSATFRAHPPAKHLVLGSLSSPRSEKPANMALLRQSLRGQNWHKACGYESGRGPLCDWKERNLFFKDKHQQTTAVGRWKKCKVALITNSTFCHTITRKSSPDTASFVWRCWFAAFIPQQMAVVLRAEITASPQQSKVLFIVPSLLNVWEQD